MRVTVKLFGTLRRLSRPETPGLWQGDIPEGTTILELVALLGTVEAEVAAAALNGEPAPLDQTIPPDAVLMLVTPVNGGV
jgi:sulfur carrier protein ThiS